MLMETAAEWVIGGTRAERNGEKSKRTGGGRRWGDGSAKLFITEGVIIFASNVDATVRAEDRRF